MRLPKTEGRTFIPLSKQDMLCVHVSKLLPGQPNPPKPIQATNYVNSNPYKETKHSIINAKTIAQAAQTRLTTSDWVSGMDSIRRRCYSFCCSFSWIWYERTKYLLTYNQTNIQVVGNTILTTTKYDFICSWP